ASPHQPAHQLLQPKATRRAHLERVAQREPGRIARVQQLELWLGCCGGPGARCWLRSRSGRSGVGPGWAARHACQDRERNDRAAYESCFSPSGTKSGGAAEPSPQKYFSISVNQIFCPCSLVRSNRYSLISILE